MLDTFQTRSIRFRISLIALACFVPMAMMASFLLFVIYEQERQDVTSSALARTRAMVVALEQELASREAALTVLAATDLLKNRELQAFHSRAIRALKDIEVQSIILIETSGQLAMSTSSPFGTPLPRLASTPLLQRILETGRGGVSELFQGPILKRPIITFGVPVNFGAGITYSLNAVLLPEQFDGILKQQNLPEKWRAAIVDANGSIISRSHEIEIYRAQKASPSLLKQIATGNDTVFESRTLEGIPVLTALSRSKRYGWYVALGMPMEDLTAGLYATTWRLGMILSVVFVVCLWMAHRISHRIGGSVQSLLAPAKALGTGELGPIPHLHFREAVEFFESLVVVDSSLRDARYAAHHDVLTGLANRSLFHDFIRQQLLLCTQNSTGMILLYIDLDGFKAVNDIHGHAIGDQLLRVAADRIKSSCRQSDVAARLGGDEFAIALIDADLKSARAFSGRLIEKISAPYQFEDLRIDGVSASIGLAEKIGDTIDAATLLDAADRAMYRAKLQGKRQYVCAEDLA